MRRLKKEFWPICITTYRYNDDIESWLESNLGKFRGRWNAVYYDNKTEYYFKNEQDSVFFALMWT